VTEPMPEPTGVRPPLGDEVLWVPQIAGEILGATIDQLIDLVRAGQLVARSVDGMLMFREGDLYALSNTRQTHAEPPEPTDHLPATRRAAVLDVAAQMDFVGNPTAAFMVRRMAGRYPEHDATEREATDLRAEVNRLTVLNRLLGPARMVLDRCAENAPGCAAEAADMAQRIVDWIGHPVTDEPATAVELQAEVYRLQHLLYGDAGPDASDPDDGDVCADVAVDGDPVRVRGQHPLSPAASEAVAEVIRVTRARLAAPCAPWHVGQHRSPDCKAGKHGPCSGDGWCDLDDQQVLCSCACHGAVVPALAGATT
jgi:hypothetical protein